MVVSVVVLVVVTLGGFALTYLVEREEPLMWRVAVGNVVGCAVFGTAALGLAMAFGLSAGTVLAALAVTALPVVLLFKGETAEAFGRDRARARGKLDGADMRKMLRFAYYVGFAVLFVFFFDRAMYQTAEGIFTGGSNNLGDLPFHLGAIYSFTDGANFPPQNPNFAGAKFSYPFIADLITACFMKLGAGVTEAMLVQNVGWAMALLVVLERFVFRLTGDKAAGKIAPVLLFFSGGLGFLWFFSDWWAQGKGLWEFLNALPKDYTIGDEFRWGNSLTTLFLTQRSLLMGMPVTILVLGFLWQVFVSKEESVGRGRLVVAVLFGLLAGTLPLIHLHSLAVLFIVTAVLLAMRPDQLRPLVAFGVGVCVAAVPELIWSTTGTASRATEFFAWHFGFDKRENGFLWFWVKNTGLLIPLIGLGIYLRFRKRDDAEGGSGTQLVEFYIPFVMLFIVANAAKLAPWEWDNIKVLIYWFAGSLPFVAIALAWMWRRGGAARAGMFACLFVLTAAGALDVWRVASRQMNFRAFDAEGVAVAEKVRASTPTHALFLNTPTYNSAVVLMGRPSLIRYPGHLSSHGIDYREREEDTKRMYAGGPEAMRLFEKYGIEYVLMSPEERASMSPNEAFFTRFPVAAQVGQYKVYKVR